MQKPRRNCGRAEKHAGVSGEQNSPERRASNEKAREDFEKLINLYSANPFALKLISESIRRLFGGNIPDFLKTGEAVFGSIQQLLDQRFPSAVGRRESARYPIRTRLELLPPRRVLVVAVVAELVVEGAGDRVVGRWCGWTDGRLARGLRYRLRPAGRRSRVDRPAAGIPRTRGRAGACGRR